MSRLTRDGTTAEPVSRDQILRRERRQGNMHFPCSADDVQDWQPYSVDPHIFATCVTKHVVVVVDSHVQRIVLATEETAVTQQVSHVDLSNANPACGHKEVRRSTGHIMVTTGRAGGRRSLVMRGLSVILTLQPKFLDRFRSYVDL